MPHGRLGLLVLVRTVERLKDPPTGNSFPSCAELQALLDEAGFQAIEQVDATQLSDGPVAWQVHADRVRTLIETRQGDETAWKIAEAQSQAIGRLLSAGDLRIVLLHAVAAD